MTLQNIGCHSQIFTNKTNSTLFNNMTYTLLIYSTLIILLKNMTHTIHIIKVIDWVQGQHVIRWT